MSVTRLAPSASHWIGGAPAAPRGQDVIEVVNPATEAPAGSVPAGTAEDVDAAVRAAEAALPGWAGTPVEERIAFLERWLGELGSRSESLARGITEEVGTPLAASRGAQVGIALGILEAYVEAARAMDFEERVGNSLVIREPSGVVGCITPWNLPLIMIMQKLPAAFAAGCTVVLKPSEITPLNANAMAEAAAEAGLPPGVLNVVHGEGPTVGEALVAHPSVRMVSFTGSTRAGRRVAAVAAEGVTRVALELGGKSANVILPDADLETAVRAGVDQAFFNAGQSCIVWSRMLVPRERQAEAAELAAELADGYRVGDPLSEDTDLGPMVSSAARERVTGYIRTGMSEGARLVAGGPEPPDEPARGWFVRPTVFADVAPDMTIARVEIFGPVLSIVPYSSEEEAIRIANDSPYGLHGAVWSGDDEHALRVARQLQTGRVDINGAEFNLLAPFGGFKQSGYGREFGRYGIEEFTELKAVQLPGDGGGLDVGARRAQGGS